MIHIYRATRGRYKKPVSISKVKINWIDENDKPTTAPVKYPCGHPKHWEWGNGTRNGQKLYYPIGEMFKQKWHMTKKEVIEAVDCFDMASLEMNGRIICENCAKNELKKLK